MSEPEKIEEEPGAEERFDKAVANALKTPPKPHRSGASNKGGQDKPVRPRKSVKMDNKS